MKLTPSEIASLYFKGDAVLGFHLELSSRRLTIQLAEAVLQDGKSRTLASGTLLLQDWESFRVQVFDEDLRQWKEVSVAQACELTEIDLDGEHFKTERTVIHGADPTTGAWMAYVIEHVNLSADFEPTSEWLDDPIFVERFLEAYCRFATSNGNASKDDDLWAYMYMKDLSAELKLPLIRRLVESASLRNLDLLGSIGAGPLEDMANDWLLDELGPDIVNDKRWLYALAMIYEFGSGGPLTKRFNQLVTPEMRQWLKEQNVR